MPSQEDASTCLLISIEAINRDGLFDSYRDYLVFMSLVRDGVRNCQFKIFGFCWIEKQCFLLIQPENTHIGGFILQLLKRYHFWLLQRGPSETEFKLRILELIDDSWTLDCLRFIHQKAVNENIVDDAMDYHWHSHHVYNDFWSINWLETHYILKQFASNRLIAMNRFRQYMMHGHKIDFDRMLDTDDVSKKYIRQIEDNGWATPHQSNLATKTTAVAEINSQYHQSLLERTQISLSNQSSCLLIKINVFKNTAVINNY
jgi:hypothetical protein